MPDPVVSSADTELRPHVEQALAAQYEIDCEIGRGGMGIVYRAKDKRLKRTVAIKVLPPELAYLSEIKSRFLREAETAAQLNHPNIVDIYSVDEAGQLVFFVMAYILGDNLAKRVHDAGTLSIEDTRRIMRDVADALAYAHQRGVIHRDIKPDNILLDAESGRPMVTDFGIARAITEGGTRLTATGQAIGTPVYMSPEQATGDREIDGRADLYALGVVAYQMLCGSPPFTAANTPALLIKHLSEAPVPIEQRRRDVPPDLARIVMTLLEKDPNARFPSAHALVAALDDSRSGGQAMMPQPRASFPPSNYPAPSQGSPYSPLPRQVTQPMGTGQRASLTFGAGEFEPTSDEIARWYAPPVMKFRSWLLPYVTVNVALLFVQLFGVRMGWVTGVWTILMAVKYASLWSAGYDWRDVLRQPRDRAFSDVIEDGMAALRALGNPVERARRRQQRDDRRAARRSGAIPALVGGPGPNDGGSGFRRSDGSVPYLPPAYAESAAQQAGVYGDQVRRAFRDRDEILRILDSMPASQQVRVADVARSGSTLAGKIQALALSLAELDRAQPSDRAIQAEIDRLEADANPLDQAASDTRVHRLAYLRRELRRGSSGPQSRRPAIEAKLDACLVALDNMKLDLLRLNAGADTHQHVTTLAMKALQLAQSVDGALAEAAAAAHDSGAPSPRRG